MKTAKRKPIAVDGDDCKAEPQHSPLPFFITTGHAIFARHGEIVADMFPMQHGGDAAMIANCELLVQAANRFPELSRIIREIVKLSDKAIAADVAMGFGFAQIAYDSRKVLEIIDDEPIQPQAAR